MAKNFLAMCLTTLDSPLSFGPFKIQLPPLPPDSSLHPTCDLCYKYQQQPVNGCFILMMEAVRIPKQQ